MNIVVNLRSNILENYNLADILKNDNNKLTMFEVTEINQDTVENTMLDYQKFIDPID